MTLILTNTANVLSAPHYWTVHNALFSGHTNPFTTKKNSSALLLMKTTIKKWMDKTP